MAIRIVMLTCCSIFHSSNIFVFIEVQLVSYVICDNVLMIMDVVLLSLCKSFTSQTEMVLILCICFLSSYPKFTIEGVFNGLQTFCQIWRML